MLAASPAYLEKRGEPQISSALSGHDLIVFEGLNPINAWRCGRNEREAVELRPRVRVTSADAAVAAAEAGLGIVRVLSYQVAKQIAQLALRPVLEAFEPPSAPVNPVYSANRAGSAKVKAFVEEALRFLRAAAP